MICNYFPSWYSWIIFLSLMLLEVRYLLIKFPFRKTFCLLNSFKNITKHILNQKWLMVYIISLNSSKELTITEERSVFYKEIYVFSYVSLKLGNWFLFALWQYKTDIRKFILQIFLLGHCNTIFFFLCGKYIVTLLFLQRRKPVHPTCVYEHTCIQKWISHKAYNPKH